MKLVKFCAVEIVPERYFLAPEKLIYGNPEQTLWLEYTDPSGRFCSGRWQSHIGKWRISYTEEEYCQMLEGVSVITDADGLAVTLSAGDSFVIPRGFEGTWEVLQPTRKIFVIYEPRANSGQ
jgi:uncharacterized cupin superfamily protein